MIQQQSENKYETTTSLAAIFSDSLEPKSLPLQELPAFASDFVGIIRLCLSQVLFSLKVLEFAWDAGELCENTAQQFPDHGSSGWTYSANTQNIIPFHSKMALFKGNWVTRIQW